MMKPATTTCDARAHDCRCGLLADHGPFSIHQCGVAGCFASWLGDTGNNGQTFRPITLPTWPPMPAVNKIVRRLRLVS